MAERREVIWSGRAEIQLRKILDFYARRNKSNRYSQKLYQQFVTTLKTAAQRPEIGIKTKLEGIRGLISGHYILFYEILEDKILVLKVWDSRQDPDKLNIIK